MTRLLARWLPTATLFCWGILLVYFFASGRLSAFLHPSFRLYVPVAGGLLMALGAASMFGSREEKGHCHDGCCGSPVAQMSLGRFLTFLVLLIPVTVAALSSHDSFGSNAIQNRGVVTNAANLVRPPEAPADRSGSSPGTISVQVTELLYAAQDPTLRPDLEGKSIEVLGQLMPEKANNASGRRFKIVRMFMTCCAADARPIAVTAEAQTALGIPEMSWVKVVGRITFPVEGGRPMAVVEAESVTTSEPPSESMLF